MWIKQQSVLRVLALVADGGLKPLIHAVRPMRRAAESIAELAARRVVGKSVLLPPRAETPAT